MMLPVLCVCVCACMLPYRYNTVDVSIAVSTEGGLITPIVFDTDDKVGGVGQQLEGWVGLVGGVGGVSCKGVVCSWKE